MAAAPMTRAIQIVAAVYAGLCILALLVIPAAAMGWLGFDKDPLAAVFAILLSMPWSLGLRLITGPNAPAATILMIGGMALNIGLLLWLSRIVGRRRGEG